MEALIIIIFLFCISCICMAIYTMHLNKEIMKFKQDIKRLREADMQMRLDMDRRLKEIKEKAQDVVEEIRKRAMHSKN